MKYRLKKCIWNPNLKERKVYSVMASLLASLGIFLGLYLSGISSLKLSLCVLGIWVCLCRWDEGLTHKSQWQYQVKKSLQSLCTFCWYCNNCISWHCPEYGARAREGRHYCSKAPYAGFISYLFSLQNVVASHNQISRFSYRLKL